jgi:hypothetical protein
MATSEGTEVLASSTYCSKAACDGMTQGGGNKAHLNTVHLKDDSGRVRVRAAAA